MANDVGEIQKKWSNENLLDMYGRKWKDEVVETVEERCLFNYNLDHQENHLDVVMKNAMLRKLARIVADRNSQFMAEINVVIKCMYSFQS